MKQLLILLKLSIVPLFVLPLALNDYRTSLQNDNLDTTGGTLTQTVNVSNQYLRTNLLDKSTEPLENIDSFYNSLPKTSVENDDYSLTRTSDNGVPQIRFGGGLFFDYGGFNASTQKQIGNNIFGDSNFTSYNEKIPVQDTNPSDDDIANKTANLTSKEDDLSNSTFSGNKRNGNFSWNLDQSQQTSYDKDNIVNQNDFNLTPNTERYTKNGKVTTGESTEKKLFRDIINKELFDWYWTTWSSQYDDRDVAEYNLNRAQIWQKNLIESKLDQSIKLDLSLAWNQLVSQTEKDTKITAANWIGSLVLAEMTEDYPGLPTFNGWLYGEILSLLMPSSYTTQSEQQNFKNYFSPALDQTFWYNLFNQYLGTPTSKSGLINTYYQKYKVLPSDVHLNNFDFYTLFKNMNLPSTMHHLTRSNPSGDDWDYKSTTDFSKLGTNFGLQLGMNFTLSRKDDNTTALMKELRKMPQLLDFYRNFTSPYTASNNVQEIRDLISAYDSKLGAITPDLTFTGKIVQGQVNYLEVYYKGMDQNFTIPLKVM